MKVLVATRLAYAALVGTLFILAGTGTAHASAHLRAQDCPAPRHVTPWHYRPAGCILIDRHGSAILPRTATEVDIWSANGVRHLTQTRDRYPGDAACPQWGFAAAHGYSVGWVTCNRDLFNFGRAVIAYYWEG